MRENMKGDTECRTDNEDDDVNGLQKEPRITKHKIKKII